MDKNVQSSHIYNSLKIEKTTSINKKLDKHILAYLEIKMLYSNLKKELQLYTRICVNLTNTKLHERGKTTCYMIHLYKL